LATLVCAVTGPAQQPATAPTNAAVQQLKSLSLEELMEVKVDKVFGASKHEQKTTEAPSSVSIVTQDDIKKYGHRTLSDILRGVRGLYVNDDRGYNSIGVRGVNRPGDYGGRMLITVDGHRLNDPIFDSAFSGPEFPLDVDLIERVEVIRGPGSSLYGNNAFFGVINVITRKGRDVNGAELSSSAGSLDTYTGRVTYGNQFTNGVELLLSGTLYDSAGNRRLSYPEFAAVNRGVAENMDGGWARSAFASLSWKGLSLEGGFVDRKKTWPAAPYSSDEARTIFNDPRFFSIDERAFANLKFQHTFENEWEVMARAYYDHYRFDGLYPYDYFDTNQPVYLNKDLAQSEGVGFEAQVSKTLFEKHRVTAGAEVRADLELTQTNDDLDPPANYLNSHESARFFSFYAQDEFQMRRNLIVNAGVRYDHFSTFGDTVNPRAALIYHPGEATTFKFLYGQAFRAPNAYEKFYESPTYDLHPGLAPETIRSYEWVCEQRLGQHWNASASLFYNDIQNLIGLQKDLEDGKVFFDNMDSVQARGAEVEVAAHWASGLRGRASYTYTHTEDGTTGRRLSNSPEHLGQLGLSVPLWRDKIFGSVELQGMSSRRTVRGGGVNGFWMANATLFSRELIKGLELSVSIYNLFDQRYRDPVADDFTQDSIQQDGRSFRVKLTYRF
jgi:iron complex outermembrane receptor protein